MTLYSPRLNASLANATAAPGDGSPPSYCLNHFLIILFHVAHPLLILPLGGFVLRRGLRDLFSPSGSAATNHSDCFTYHMVAMEMLIIVGSLFFFHTIASGDAALSGVYSWLTTVTWHGQTMFHVLTCAERYMAVVHPVAYMRSKSKRGTLVRNFCIGCVWCLSVTSPVFLSMPKMIISTLDMMLLAVSLVTVSYWSLSALRGLARPGPARQGREGLGQSRQRAFYTMASIVGTLALRFCWGVIWAVVSIAVPSADCEMMRFGLWFQLPSSLVLPLLFVHRAGTFAFLTKRR